MTKNSATQERDRLERLVKHMTMSKCSAEEEFGSKSHLMTELKKNLPASYNVDDVLPIIEKRIESLRHQRADVRASLYRSSFPTPMTGENADEKERQRLEKFGAHWPNFTDVQRVLEMVKKKTAPSRSRKSARQLDFNPNLEWKLAHSSYFQGDLENRCKYQIWPGVCDVVFPEMGRGVIALTAFKQFDVIFDYHGHVEENANSVTYYCSQDPINRKPEYCVEVQTRPPRIIDASSEICPIHPDGRRCLARLCNFSQSTFRGGQTNRECNMKLVELKCNRLPEVPRHVLLIAKRPIEPLEQLMFDYMDPEANRIFGSQQ